MQSRSSLFRISLRVFVRLGLGLGLLTTLYVLVTGVSFHAHAAPAATKTIALPSHSPVIDHIPAALLASTVSDSTVQGGSVVLSGSPGAPVANPMTNTLYVPIQCPKNFCSSSAVAHVVDVINAAKCNVYDTSDCRVIARATVGKDPIAAAIDEKTDTIYVTSGSGTVSVVNGARCNAAVTSGCSKPLATINVGGFLVAAAFNPATRTLYVANLAGSVFVIDVAACNAVTTRGCGRPVKTVADSLVPAGIAIDVATDTVYTVNPGKTGNGNTVSVINGATCNGSNGSGCGRAPLTITVGNNPSWDVVDQATDTVYVANYNDGTVSVINGATCNATITSGCGHTPPSVATGAGTSFVGIDDTLHTVFAINQQDDTLSAINTKTCKGSMTSGCPTLAPAQQAASNQGPRYNGYPNNLAILPETDSAYLVNEGGANILSVVNLSRCDASQTSGCRVDAPSVPAADFQVAIDPATDTIYAGNLNLPQIDVLNGATCDARHLSGCAPVAKIPVPHASAIPGAIDEATHTLYSSDRNGNTISVINTAACNATDTAGCAEVMPTITIGSSPGSAILDSATRTLYAPFGTSANEVAVVDAATCNAKVTSGCGQRPGVVTVGTNTFVIGLSTKTDTIYAPSLTDNTVSVINGARCNGTDHSGCGHLAATVKVGLSPYGIAVDDLTHTVYVANNANGASPGTLSIINGATCNGSDTAGCSGPMPTVVVGRAPLLVAVDTSTDFVYVTDNESAGVSVVNGATCNAEVTKGCRHPAPLQAVGSQPFGLAVNQDSNTVYAVSEFNGSIAIFKGSL